MTTAEIRIKLHQLINKNVAVIYKGNTGPTIWGKLLYDGSKFNPWAILSFKTGLFYVLTPTAIDFIEELKVKPEEIEF